MTLTPVQAVAMAGSPVTQISSEPCPDAQRFKRGRRLRLALVFSVFSKAAGVVTQVLALTLGVQLLGKDGYAAYATLWATSLTPYLFMLGYGPTLVTRIAHLDANNQSDNLRATTWSALVPLFLNMLVVGIISSLLFARLSPVELFPKLTELHQPLILTVLIGLIWYHLAGSILNAIENVQAGFQENYLLSVRATLGNLISAGLLATVFCGHPKLWVFVACLQGPMIATRILNGIIFFFRKRHLMPGVNSLDWGLVRGLIAEGFIFSVVSGVAAYLCHQLPLLLLASYQNPNLAEASATMNLVLQLFSVVSMIAVPFVPALANSLRLGDFQWARRNLRRMSGWIGAYGIFCTLFLATVGPAFYAWWFRGQLDPGVGLLAGAGAYLLILGLENFLFLVLCSLNQLRLASSLYLVRALVSAGVAWMAARWGQAWLIFSGECLTAAVITLGPYFYLTTRCVNDFSRNARELPEAPTIVL